ncbi:MAG: hypothetical protein LBL69_05925 [Zoogloeaceae bacterium]|jgi:hypothetical protein|nr:hypothetical protein [Zoogloeaceae bacterium]
MAYLNEDRLSRLAAANSAIRALRGIGIRVMRVSLGQGESLPQLVGQGREAQLPQLCHIATGVRAPQFDARAFAVFPGALAVIHMQKEHHHD